MAKPASRDHQQGFSNSYGDKNKRIYLYVISHLSSMQSLVVSEVDESMDDLLTFKTANAKLSVTDNEREEEAADMKEEAADVDIEMKREGSDPNSAEKVGTDDPISPTDDPVLPKRPRKLSGKEEGQKKKTRSSVCDPVPRKHYANEQEHPRAKVETEKKAAVKSNPKPKAIPKPNSTPKPTKQGSHTMVLFHSLMTNFCSASERQRDAVLFRRHQRSICATSWIRSTCCPGEGCQC